MNAFADTVILRSGQKISGDIVERNTDAVRVQFEGVTLTYYMDELQSINGEMVEQPVSESSVPAAPFPGRPVSRNQRGDLIREVPPGKESGYVAPGKTMAAEPAPQNETVVAPSDPVAEPVSQG